jgi:hypothetical protein
MSVEKDFKWVKKCIESCIHLTQLETARKLSEAYLNKWILLRDREFIDNVNILERTLQKKQDELK